MAIQQQYLDILDKFNWEIPTGGGLENIWYKDQCLSERPDIIQQFSQSTTIPSIIIYFPIGYWQEIFTPFKYPSGMSVLQILGAIDTFYKKLLTVQEFQRMSERDRDLENVTIGDNMIFEDGRPVTRGETIPPFFEGMEPFEGGYTLILSS